MDAAPRGLGIVLDGNHPALLGRMRLLPFGYLAFGLFPRFAGETLGGHRGHGGPQLGDGAAGLARDRARVGQAELLVQVSDGMETAVAEETHQSGVLVRLWQRADPGLAHGARGLGSGCGRRVDAAVIRPG